MSEKPELDIFTVKCVEWYEALNWVAFKSFADPPGGPRAAFEFARDRDKDYPRALESFDRKEGRRELAAWMILDKAEKNTIRILGFHQDIPQDEGEDPDAPLQESQIDRYPKLIPAEFFKRSYSLPDYFENSFANDAVAFHNPIVVVEDLWHEFWGAPAEPNPPDVDASQDTAPTVRQANDLAASRLNLGDRKRRGGGRPRGYDWPGFVIEMIRQLQANGLPDRRGEREAQMLLWCSEHWSKEPAVSMVREWIAAFYNEFMADRATGRPPRINDEVGT